jgi:hypothetical protein
VSRARRVATHRAAVASAADDNTHRGLSRSPIVHSWWFRPLHPCRCCCRVRSALDDFAVGDAVADSRAAFAAGGASESVWVSQRRRWPSGRGGGPAGCRGGRSARSRRSIGVGPPCTPDG